MFSSDSTQVSSAVTYIEDVFSTYLYTGTGASQTVTNGIDLSTKGGLTWIKSRSGSTGHRLTDTARGVTKSLASETTAAQATETTGLTAFGTTGFTIGADADYNTSAATYASWTFRKQPKFFDVVTYTGTGSNTTIAHNLGAVPGCIFVKRTDTTGAWQVYHRSLANTQYLVLNTTAAAATGATRWNSTTPTSTVFSLGTDATVNASGGTYVAYIFAHNAGGFGLTGTDNVISCGVCSQSKVELGYEPQWILIRENYNSLGGWYLVDNMRGMSLTSQSYLYPNSVDPEFSVDYMTVDATGFALRDFSANNLYIAIRRGPMKVPTDGTSVFAPVIYTGNSSVNTVTSNFPVDLSITKLKNSTGPKITVIDRLRGFGTVTDGTKYLFTSATDAEGGASDGVNNMGNTGLTLGAWGQINGSPYSFIDWMFQRAPSFFDEVCYTGTGSNPRNITHNLTVIPELIIVKGRNSAGGWSVYSSAIGNTKSLLLNSTSSSFTSSAWNNTTPTSSVFTTGSADTNELSTTYVAYLFATCAGVSKVGSYTGNGSTQTINCGFTGGARFVLIKRTNSTGDWYVWDTARGMVSGTDPSLLLNSTAAEVNANSIYTTTGGFQIVSTAAGINASGGTYIFLAIA